MSTAHAMRLADRMRAVRLTPYMTGKGPTFTLELWDGGERWEGSFRRQYVFYRLTMREPGKASVVLFSGHDIGLPMFQRNAIDSDETVASVLGWLTLKPGDTDADFFASYTPAQLAFASEHAESLSCYATERFGEV
jgi:hypothetical protein